MDSARVDGIAHQVRLCSCSDVQIIRSRLGLHQLSVMAEKKILAENSFVVGMPRRRIFCKLFGPSRIRTYDQGIMSPLL
jgi:hypothetical protein